VTGRGRPTTGTKIQVRIDPGTLSALDSEAAVTGISRAEAIRRTVATQRALYAERNLLAQLVATMLGGWVVGIDSDNPDMPVLAIATSAGQISWHINPDDLVLDRSPVDVSAVWDGHDKATAQARIRALIERT
jgi:hypothetical protein